MHLIQPCCAKKNLLDLREAIKKGGTAQFEGYGDLSLTELLPALLTRYAKVEMMIVAPKLPDQAAEIIGTWMRMQRARTDGQGKMDFIKHLTIIADLSEEYSPMASMWLKENPFGDRLTLVDRRQPDTAILLPDIALYGPINLRYGYHFTATATTQPEMVERLWTKYRRLTEPVDKPVSADKQRREPPAPRKSRKRKKG